MIAAGEVVTRPSSALKEILENAIDAKATEIEIHLYQHGLGEIKVIDNGIGMDQADLELAFLRHATSKIKNEYDLAHIKSLGFRGEAIPAIASVSKMCIQSKSKDSLPHEVYYEGGKQIHSKKTSCNQGTTVTIKDLFYNVPARLKYIKSPQTELALMIEVSDEMMLAHPNIAFSVFHEQKKIRQSYGDQNYTNLFQSVYGSDVAQQLIEHHYIENAIDKKTYLIKHVVTRSRKNDIVILINGRSIKNYALINAVVEGYHTHLMVSRYPIALIDIKLDTSLIDVNVHPQKREIKFSNEYHIAKLISKTIRQAFMAPQTIKDALKKEDKYVKISGFELLEQTINEESYREPEVLRPNKKLPDMDYIESYAGTYLIFQNENGLYLLDQHAAAERIRYEAFYERLGQIQMQSKQLLTPITYQFKPTEAATIKANQDLISSYGLTLEHFKDYTYLVRSLPIWLEDKDVDYMIYGFIDQLENKKQIDLSRLRDQLVKDISCKGAIKANKALSILEIDHLFKALQACENPYYCPHGRPISINFSLYEIEKMFKRIV